jgi:signal transduction histidine kinase
MTLRARLGILGLLSFLALLAAAASLAVLARNSDAQRVERAEESLAESLEPMRDGAAPPPMRPGMHGVLDPDGRPRGLGRELRPAARAARDSLRQRALQGSEVVFARITLDGGEGARGREGVLVLGAVARPDGSVAWAGRMVPTARGMRGARVAVAALALVAVVLVAVALRTLTQTQRDTEALRRSLLALREDLSAPVESPSLGELATVAEGLRGLAEARAHAEAERVRLEAALAAKERLAALGRVVAGVAHEVRNPLASMKLKVDLARMQPGVAPAMDADLRELGDEISRLDRLVADLLVVSGRRSGPMVPCDLGVLVAKRAALLDGWAEGHGVRLAVQGAARATADVDGVSRVIDNLLRNAVQASPRGATVTARLRVDGARGAALDIEDHGEGVPPGREGELFEPFFTTRAEGTGLGLAMSRAVAEAHGGTLRYQRDGDVTRFSLRLPG